MKGAKRQCSEAFEANSRLSGAMHFSLFRLKTTGRSMRLVRGQVLGSVRGDGIMPIHFLGVEPLNRLRIEIDIDLLHFCVSLQSERSQFSPPAALLITAPRTFVISIVVGVHPGDTSFDGFNDTVRPGYIVAKNCPG